MVIIVCSSGGKAGAIRFTLRKISSGAINKENSAKPAAMAGKSDNGEYEKYSRLIKSAAGNSRRTNFIIESSEDMKNGSEPAFSSLQLLQLQVAQNQKIIELLTQIKAKK